MGETPGGFLKCLIHAGWSLRHRGLASSPWLSADLPASPIQHLTPTPALLTFGWFSPLLGRVRGRFRGVFCGFTTCSHLHVLIAARAEVAHNGP